MKVKLRLTKDLCPGGGDVIPATGEDATFRLVRCPICGRQNLKAENARAVGSAYEVTLPQHRARASVGQPVPAYAGAHDEA
jgi:hypothetical protein